MNILSVSCLFILLNFFPSGISSYSCKSLDGKNVDWFIIYKYPHLYKREVSSGTVFLYSDPETPWRHSDRLIDDKNSSLGLTVSQLMTASKDEFYAAYNDEHPTGKTDSGRGHMKGVLYFNDISGFWLIHSVPKFPMIDNDYSYPRSGMIMGQSFLCITFSSSELNNIGNQLLYGRPSIYYKNLPSSFAHFYPKLSAALNGRRKFKISKTQTTSSVLKLNSLKGQIFYSFYKNKKFGEDLYDALVAPELASSLYVESWMNGAAQDLSSDCKTEYKVINVRALNVMNISFESSRDHSKWAVSIDETKQKNWICIGDINRQKSQEHRGGGTTCFTNPQIASLYKLSVSQAEYCGDVDIPNRTDIEFKPKNRNNIAEIQNFGKHKSSF